MSFSQKATRSLVAFLFLCFTVLVFSSKATYSQDAEKPTSSDKDKSEFYFATGDKFGTPLEKGQTNFGCTDKVYLVAQLRQVPKGKHIFTVLWRDPSGDVRETTEYDFHVTQEESKLWAWVRLSRARGAGMLSWINPAAGLEEFIGEWAVEVLVDKKRVNKGAFTVTC